MMINDPIVFQAIFVMSVIDYSELTYDRPTAGVYVYPQWAVGVGWALAALSAICIPLTAIYKTVRYLVYEKKVNTKTKFNLIY